MTWDIKYYIYGGNCTEVSSKKLKIRVMPYDPGISLLGLYLENHNIESKSQFSVMTKFRGLGEGANARVQGRV